MDKGVLYFQRVQPILDFLDEVFKFDVRTLPNMDAEKLSQYCVALSQFLIFMKSEIGKTQSEIQMKQRFIDTTVNMLLTTDMIKRFKTKTAATDHIINNSQPLQDAREEIGRMKDELVLLDGQDRSIMELINAFKRELTRRENELHATRMERR
jgi:hypothetical protein